MPDCEYLKGWPYFESEINKEISVVQELINTAKGIIRYCKAIAIL